MSEDHTYPPVSSMPKIPQSQAEFTASLNALRAQLEEERVAREQAYMQTVLQEQSDREAAIHAHYSAKMETLQHRMDK
jgi:alkylhydroperoxidase family enzyme